MNDLIPRFMNPAFERSDVFLAGTEEEQRFARALSRDGVAVIDPHIPVFDVIAAEVV